MYNTQIKKESQIGSLQQNQNTLEEKIKKRRREEEGTETHQKKKK